MATTAHSPRRTRAQTPAVPDAEILRVALQELRELKEEREQERQERERERREIERERREQRERQAELESALHQCDQMRRQMEQRQTQLSQNSIAQNAEAVGGAEIDLGFKLKPDIYDGTVPTREFFAQFDFIARANGWGEVAKTAALVSCLRGKARSVLEGDSVESVLGFRELKSRVELRFGEGQSSKNYYSLFVNRKQEFGEDFPTFGAELERLARLAYPECSYEIRDKIACSHFIIAIEDNFVRRTLQLENVTSLKSAVERAMIIKGINE